MDFLEICAQMTSACPTEGEDPRPLSVGAERIVSACASVAYGLLAEAARQQPTVNREALAHALHDAYVADATIVWGERCEDVRQGYLREADEAIRLCTGAKVERIFACPSCGPQDRCDEDGCCITHGLDLIEVADKDAAYAVKEACGQLISDWDADRAKIADLEQRNATLAATANAAAERAESAEGVLKFMEVEVARMSRERDAATARAQKAEEMRAHLVRLQARAEEAEVRAARAEKALRLSADAAEAATTDEEDARQELYDTRAENDRLRRSIAAALRGAQHIATSAALLTGEADDA